MSERFRVILKILFIVFAIATIASLVAPDYAPSLWKTLPGLIVIHLVRSSAEHMAESATRQN